MKNNVIPALNLVCAIVMYALSVMAKDPLVASTCGLVAGWNLCAATDLVR